MNGAITELPTPTDDSYPVSITSGPDGNIWFTERQGFKIGRVNLKNLVSPDDAILSPFNKGATWTVDQGYYNNRAQTPPGCIIGVPPDHCQNQLFGLDIVADQQDDKEILAPANGVVDFRGELPDKNCIGMRIKLDNGLNMNVCHFASYNVQEKERVLRGKILGLRSSDHVHLSLDDRHRTGSLCPGTKLCHLPVPFSGPYTLEGISFEPDPNGETVTIPYPGCAQKKNISCQFKVGFQQYQGFQGTSTNVAIP